ncbi:MAG: hypothetical protein F4027_09140, partial [Rhodospirillaceae bacterium]|nr:hypothetical protein [Rhodospirillaceae bacterium]
MGGRPVIGEGSGLPTVRGKAVKHWTLDDIAWENFDPGKVDPDLVKVIKAASLVEKNGRDYGRYLQEVFEDDPEFSEAAIGWAEEEVQHGDALGRW